MRRRDVGAWAITFGPAAAWLAWAELHYGGTHGYGRVLALASVTAVGILGLTAVFVAWFPATMERLGFRRLAAWLRTWWDEDAR